MFRCGFSSALLVASLLTGCSRSADSGSFSCGFSALTAPLAVQDALGRGQALPTAPWNPPDSLPVRMVAGPIFRGSVKEEKTGWLVRVAEALPEGGRTGFAVLVTDGKGNNHGILLFDGPLLQGATVIGSIEMATRAFPLIGVRMSTAAIRNNNCPMFGPPAK